ncbi:MAG: DNA-binding response regulator, partial [Nitrospirae bacterium]
MGPLILIVDDDEGILKVLEANLGLYGFRTLTAMTCH